MKYFFNFFFVIFAFCVYSQPLKVDSIEFKTDYIIYGKDTFNRFNSFGNKEGNWLKYKNNRWFLTVNSNSGESTIFLDSIILGEKYFIGEKYFYNIFVFQICEYQNGLKNGECKEYYENDNIKYIANFEKDELINMIYYNFDGEIIATIKRNNNGNYKFIQNNKIIEYTKKEIYSIFEFE